MPDAVKGKRHMNPPFDPRIKNLHMLTGGTLKRGWMHQANKNSAGEIYGVNFLYNPESVNLSHSVDTSIVPVTDPNDDSKLVVPLQQSLSFSLLFDRTYETWDSSYKNKYAGKWGVHADVLAIYNIVGITNDTSTDASDYSPITGDATIKHTLQATSPMLYTPVKVWFGVLQYYGVITSLDIAYSHWTQKLVPSRCAVSITVQLLPKMANQTGSSTTIQPDLGNQFSTSKGGPTVKTNTGSNGSGSIFSIHSGGPTLSGKSGR